MIYLRSLSKAVQSSDILGYLSFFMLLFTVNQYQKEYIWLIQNIKRNVLSLPFEIQLIF